MQESTFIYVYFVRHTWKSTLYTDIGLSVEVYNRPVRFLCCMEFLLWLILNYPIQVFSVTCRVLVRADFKLPITSFCITHSSCYDWFSNCPLYSCSESFKYHSPPELLMSYIHRRVIFVNLYCFDVQSLQNVNIVSCLHRQSHILHGPSVKKCQILNICNRFCSKVIALQLGPFLFLLSRYHNH